VTAGPGVDANGNNVPSGTVTVTSPGTADGVGGGDPSIISATTGATIFSTTLRATTPFEIRGSRTSLSVYSALNSFDGIAPLVPTNP
jgi:hypothetical protein